MGGPGADGLSGQPKSHSSSELSSCHPLGVTLSPVETGVRGQRRHTLALFLFLFINDFFSELGTKVSRGVAGVSIDSV